MSLVQLGRHVVRSLAEPGLAAPWRCNIYAYDAYLIAAARKHRCELVSLDRGLVHAARQAGVPILEVI